MNKSKILAAELQRRQQQSKRDKRNNSSNTSRVVSRVERRRVDMPLNRGVIVRSGPSSQPVVLRHRELWLDIKSGSVDYFGVHPFAPALPWLRRISSNYDRFKFRSLTVEYVPICANTTAGYVIIGYEPDLTGEFDTPGNIGSTDFERRRTLSQIGQSMQTPAWQPMTFRPKLKPLIDTQAVTHNASGLNTDNKLESAGAVIVYSFSDDPGTLLGSMWVEYEVELSMPRPSVGFVDAGFQGVGNTITGDTLNTIPAFSNGIREGTTRLQVVADMQSSTPRQAVLKGILAGRWRMAFKASVPGESPAKFKATSAPTINFGTGSGNTARPTVATQSDKEMTGYIDFDMTYASATIDFPQVLMGALSAAGYYAVIFALQRQQIPDLPLLN